MKFRWCNMSKAKNEDKKQDVISCEAEYSALREEKIFRYGYSNSMNTTLLTITLAVFSVGGLMFTMSGNNVWKLAEIFFPLFFLLPCLFARICFRYLLRNSVRIGLLSEYMRTHLNFQNDVSWEKIKKKEKINYFMSSEKYIGGVLDVPLCVTVVSFIFSAIVAHYFMYQDLHGHLNVFFISLLAFIPIVVALIWHQFSNGKKMDFAIVTICLVAEIIAYVLFAIYMQDYWSVLLSQALYYIPLLFVTVLIPNFRNEIKDAEKIFKEYKGKMRKYKE